MRTTLDIADDVLFAAKDCARRDKKTLGQVISEWGRMALHNSSASQMAGDQVENKQAASAVDQQFLALGFVTLPMRDGVGPVSNALVNRLRDEEGV